MDLDDIINDMIYDLTDKAFSKLRETDTELDYAVTRTVELSEQVRDILDKLPEDERSVIDEYQKLKEVSDGKQMLESYKQGARDCTVILKKLGVI